MLWTILAIVGGLVGLLIVGVIALVAYAYLQEAQKEKAVRSGGRPVVASLVMANHTLQDPEGDPQTAGVVVFSFEPASPQLAQWLRMIGAKVYELYTADDVSREPAASQAVAAIIKDHNYSESRRNPLPAELTGGRAVFMADLWVHRNRLPANWDQNRTLACKATSDGTGTKGQIIMLGTEEPEAQQLYHATR